MLDSKRLTLASSLVTAYTACTAHTSCSRLLVRSRVTRQGATWDAHGEGAETGGGERHLYPDPIAPAPLRLRLGLSDCACAYLWLRLRLCPIAPAPISKCDCAYRLRLRLLLATAHRLRAYNRCLCLHQPMALCISLWHCLASVLVPGLCLYLCNPA